MSEIKKINVGGTEYSLPEGGGGSSTPILVGTYTFDNHATNTVNCSNINATDLEKNHIYMINVTLGGTVTMGFMFFLTNTGINYIPTLMANFSALGVNQLLLIFGSISAENFTVWFVMEDFTFFEDSTFTQNIMDNTVIELYKL